MARAKGMDRGSLPRGRKSGSDPDWGYDQSTSLQRFLRAESKAYPRRGLGSSYRNLLGPNPQGSPSDRRTAMIRVHLLEKAVDRGGWTPNEWGRLYTMLAKWRARAAGSDARYALVGNRPGRVTREQRQYLDFKARVARVLKLHEKSQEKSEA